MPDNRIEINIIGKDAASPVFAKVASGAEKMGKSVATAAKQATTALKDNEKATKDLQVGMAALGVGFTMAARASADQARQLDAINRLYGESADEVVKLSEAIQDNTRFSNDQAREAAITGSTLAQNYGITADQIGVLIERSADLAQIHGIDLNDAMERVSGAIRGEGEAAELLGLNMSDSAVAAAAAAQGLTGWTTTMTEAEKAAFRYSLVLQQTEATQGAAADAADTTAGKIAHLANEVQDAAVNFVGWTGPVGEATAALSSHAVEIAVVGGGLVKLASGMKEAGAATQILNLALGPVGLVAAAGLATFAVYELVTADNDLDRTMKATGGATTAFANELAKLGASGSKSADDFKKVSDAFAQILIDQVTLQQAIQAGGGGTGGIMAELSAKQINEIRDAIIELFNNPFVDADKITTELLKVFDLFQTGQIDGDKLRDTIKGDAVAWSQFAVVTEKIGTKVADTIAKFKEQQDAVKGNVALLNDFATATAGASGKSRANAEQFAKNLDAIADSGAQGAAQIKKWVDALNSGQKTLAQVEAEAARVAAGLDVVTASLDGTTRGMRDMGRSSSETAAALAVLAHQHHDVAAAMDGTAVSAAKINDAFRESDISGINKAMQSLGNTASETMAALAVKGAQDPFGGASLSLAELTVAAGRFIDAAASTETALERVARGSSSAAVQLRAFKDVQDGIIAHQDVFNQQFSEYGSQLSDIERAQQILNDRRAEGQTLSEEELAFLDGAAAAQERLTGGQEDAAIAAGMLAEQYAENMKIGDEMNASLEGVTKTTGALTESINALILALGGVPPNTDPKVDVHGTEQARADVTGVTGDLTTLDGTSANPSVSVAGIGDALSGVLALQGAIAGLDGMSAVTNVRNVVTNETRNVVTGLGFRDGGIVPHAFARDGLSTRDVMAVTVGEAGRETVLLPGGSYVRNAAATAAHGGARGMSVVFNIARVDAANFDEFLTEAERLVRARFAGLGL